MHSGGVFLVVGAILAAEWFARVGSAVSPSMETRLGEWGVSFLLGLCATGITLLGLSLAGLFHPLAIIGVSLALGFGARRMWSAHIGLMSALREGARFGPWVGILSGTVALTMLPRLLTPEGEDDCRVYHLGVPWQFLQGGKALLEHVQFNFHIPLTVEMAYTLPLLFGEERLAKWLVFTSFVAACAVFAGSRLLRGDRAGAWLGPLVAVCSDYMLHLTTVAKNDVPAAALFVVGGLLSLSGRWVSSAVLLGLCVGSKFVYAPLVLAWMLAHPPPRRYRLPWAGLVLLPCLPWMAKSWLATGNPCFQFATSVFPALHLSSTNRDLFSEIMQVDRRSTGILIADLPWNWLNSMRLNYLPVLLLLPYLLIERHRRRNVMALCAGTLPFVFAVRMDRFFLPAVWLLSFLSVERLGASTQSLRMGLSAVAGMWVLARVAISPVTARNDWGAVLQPYRMQWDARFTTLGETEKVLRTLGPTFPWFPRRPRPMRILNVGHWHAFPQTGRVLFNGTHAETPLIWRVLRESHDEEDISRKVRQLGARLVLYNYVSASWYALNVGRFQWDDRMVRMYTGFCRRWLVTQAASPHCDMVNGGFIIYRVMRRPLSTPPPAIAHLPGAETVSGEGVRLGVTGRTTEGIVALMAACVRAPEVQAFHGQLGYVRGLAGDWPGSYRDLKPLIDSDIRDMTSLPTFALAALRLGRYPEAARAFELAAKRYPADSARYRVLAENARERIRPSGISPRVVAQPETRAMPPLP